MALMLLRVFLLGVLAAAADDIPITWSVGPRAQLPCAAPLAERLLPRRPPPPLDDDRPRPRLYLWRRGEDDISSKRVSPTGSLEVSRRRDGEAVYQCLVRHHGGLVRGYPTHLKFASMEKQFSVHPENATARSGQPFILTCSISSAPPANVVWLWDDLPLPADDRYHVLQNQLLITDVTPADEGSYRCVATNPYLNKTRTSHAGTLQVELDNEDQALAFLPVEHQGSIMAPQGNKVVLPCPVTGWPRPKMIWELEPPEERRSELDVVDEVFVIRSLQPDQEGVYTCSVEGNSELVKTFSVTLTEPARITIPPTSREVLRASTVRFNCTASGRPEPAVTWYKDGQLLQMAGRINLRKSTDGQRTELVISGVTSEDAGVYQCFASNSAGQASYWAMLNVTGPDAAAPTNVKCWPIGDKRVKVTWQSPDGEVVAYTVHGTPEEEKAGNSLPGHPLTNTEEIVTVTTPLVPYRFQVRAYSRVIKSTASDLSAPAICQGQGVPIRLAKLDDDSVIVSWKHFAEETAGVVQWILQYKEQKSSQEHNVTLDGAVYNYTFDGSAPLLVRVLGTKSLPWLQQDLSLVPWSSTENADSGIDPGDVTAIPQDIEVTQISPREFSLTWHCDEADSRFTYMVCVKSEGIDKCMESKDKSATFDNLQPGTEYEVRIQARIANRALGGAFSGPYIVMTPSESPQRFKELSGHFINASTLKVSWNGAPAKYIVHHSAQLKLPVEQWDSVETMSNSVLIPGIDPTETTFLMVTGYDPEEHSKIETIPPLFKDLEVKDLQYEYTRSGVRVWWSNTGGAGPRVVSYSQNITTPLEQWTKVVAHEPQVELTVDPSLPTYVMVTSSKKRRSQVLTITVRPVDNSTLHLVGTSGKYASLKRAERFESFVGKDVQRSLRSVQFLRRESTLDDPPCSDHASQELHPYWIALLLPRAIEFNSPSLGVGLGVLALLLLGLAAVCLWRRRKASRSPVRSRRRNQTPTEGTEEAEMKEVCGARARLANGGAQGAGEPLLNGHVHITENPTLKTPNGKMKKGRRYEAAFDVSRYEDPEATLDTTLDDSTAYNLLDTSRRPEYDHSRSSRDMSTDNSFTKLPDDNMNSELTRSTFQRDNSKIQPTLQPNG